MSQRTNIEYLTEKKYSTKSKKLQIQIMKQSKVISSAFSSLCQLILQHRINVKKQFLMHLEELKEELVAIRNCYHSSQDILYFLVENQSYEIKNKVLVKSKTANKEILGIEIILKTINKQTSEVKIMEVWQLSAQKIKSTQKLSKQDINRQIGQMVETLLKSLQQQYIFSDLISNANQKKRIIIDFEINLHFEDFHNKFNIQHFGNYSLNTVWLSNQYQISLACYHSKRPVYCLQISLQAPQNQFQCDEKQRKNSISTEAASELSEELSVSAEYHRHLKRCSSNNEQGHVYEFYDEDLDITVISSDSQSFKRSPRRYSEIVISDTHVEQTQQFELLFDDYPNRKDEHQLFLEENSFVFEKMASLEMDLFN